MSRRYLERVLLGEERGAISWLIRGIAWPFSLAYRTGLAAFFGTYTLGVRKKHRLGVPVLSVGNLTFGGTGKTPAVEAITRMLVGQGRRVAILSRGHGGAASGPLVVSDGNSITASASECGDEPAALARALPGVPIVVGKDRRASGDLACRQFRPDVILLDDGLQYWQLHRDLDIVVMDALRPFGSGFVMPMGDLREPRTGLRRARVILLNGARDLESNRVEKLEAEISRLAPGALILRCARRPRGLVGPGGTELPPEWLRGRRVLAFCGIGRPDSFFEILKSLGADVCERLPFPDHYRYTTTDLALIGSRREVLEAEAIVTTEKDRVRLDELSGSAGEYGPEEIEAGDSRVVCRSVLDQLYVLGVELEIEEQFRLAELIASVLDGTSQASATGQEAD
ncbi:MAG: tetraacyldisaccharide 4'-kinase [Armatimonadota bacterium]